MPTFLSFEMEAPPLSGDLLPLVKRRFDSATLRAARVLEPGVCVLGLAGPMRASRVFSEAG
jgi:hypothetical protein